MIDGSEPRPDICDVAGCGEVEDVIDELGGWLDAIISDQEAKEVYFPESKLELLGIEGATIPGGSGQELADPEEVVLYAIIVDDGVIDACLTIREAI